PLRGSGGDHRRGAGRDPGGRRAVGRRRPPGGDRHRPLRPPPGGRRHRGRQGPRAGPDGGRRDRRLRRPGGGPGGAGPPRLAGSGNAGSGNAGPGDGGVRLTLAEIAGATAGHVLGGDPGAAVTSYSIDSRTLRPGALFVALRAERDGHDFVGDALDRGAGGALVARVVEGERLVLVQDTAAALTALGATARDRLAAVPVVGIT